MKDKRIGRIIRDRRLEFYGTQQEAYTAAGVGQTTWQLAESGQLPKSPRIRLKITRALRWPDHALDNLEAELEPGTPATLVSTEPGVAERLDAMAGQLAELVKSVRALAARQAAPPAEVPTGKRVGRRGR